MSEQKSGVINKTFNIIRSFADVQEQWGVRELAKHLNYPTSTLHRLLLQLQSEGILEYNTNSDKYEIGAELTRLSSGISARSSIIKISKPILEKFVEKHHQTICLIMYHKNEKKVSFIHKIDGPDILQYKINLGDLQPVPYGCSGKAILAFLDQKDIEYICQRENFSERKVEEIKDEIKIIQKKGYSYSEEDRIKGSKGIGAPIFNVYGEPIGSISYSIPISFQPLNVGELIEDIKKASDEISVLLGYKKKIKY